MDSEELRIVLRVSRLLASLNVAHHLGGSFASSIHGVPRQTRDADIVADLSQTAVATIVETLEAEFYVDEPMIRDAITRRASFYLIHLDSGFKIDIFVTGTSDFDRQEMARSTSLQLTPDPADVIHVKSVEDLILRKLDWYRLGGCVSDRHWSDILGVLGAQKTRLDRKYLALWADRPGVHELLGRALSEQPGE